MLTSDARCEKRYPVPQTSPPREEAFEVLYRCSKEANHVGPCGLQDDESPPLPDARLEQIRERVKNICVDFQARQSKKAYEDEFLDDLNWLLVELTRLRAERDEWMGCTQALEVSLTDAQHRANAEYTQRVEAEHTRDALHAQLEELKDCVCDWINEGLIVPDGRLSSMLASAPPAAKEET